MGRVRCGVAATVLLAVPASCGSDASNAESGSIDASCVVPADRATVGGACTLVDWDATAISGNAVVLTYYVNEPGCSLDLDRVDVDESADAVRLSVIVGFAGDDGATCPTAYGSRTTTVTLAAPLGARALLGCRPIDSFVPQGGYNEPAPRDPLVDCAPSP